MHPQKPKDKRRFIQSRTPLNKRQALQCDTGDNGRELRARRQPSDFVLEIDQEPQYRSRLVRLAQYSEPARLESPGDRVVWRSDETPGLLGNHHPIVGHPGRELACETRL